MQFRKVKKKLERIILKELALLEDGKQIEKETAIRILNAVSELLRSIQQ